MIERMFDRVAEEELGSVLGGVPDYLEEIPPGYVLAAVLDDIDVESCTGYDRVRVIKAHKRMVSHYAARGYSAISSLVDEMGKDVDETEYAEEAAAAEIRAALRLTRRAADSETSFALELKRRLPLVWEALADGTIDTARARVIVNSTLHLSIAGARDVVDHVLQDAGLLTTGQLGAKLRKLCIDVDPEDATTRYRRAVEDRRVVTQATDDGTANLFALDLDPCRVAEAASRINQIARSLRRAGEPRTMDQLRADVFLDILTGTKHTTIGSVDIRTDLPTLTRLAESSADLAGFGPVIGDIARQVAEHQTTYNYTVVDPDRGQPILSGTTKRRPTRQQRRQVLGRDLVCVFPGCRMPATGCDLDHTTPYREHGPTHPVNMAPLCEYDHTGRHRHGWTYSRTPNGDYQWTTRTGHTHTTTGQPP